MANFKYIVIIFLLVWLPTEATLTLTGSNSYIESNEDFVLNCFTDVDPAITRALLYKDNAHIVTLTYQLGNCYEDSTLCSVTKMCDCNTRNYTWTFNGVIQTQPVLFECRVQFAGNPVVWKKSILTLSLATSPTSDPAITIDPSGPIYNEGAVTMTCEVEGGIPLATISWKCPVPSVETVSQNADTAMSTVHLTVNKTHNGKACICEATHPLWEIMKSTTQNIVVYYGPESVTLTPRDTQYTVTEGNNVPNINCTADCIPACNYTWSGPGVPTGTTDVLSLQNVKQYQRGVFNCTAYNIVNRLKSADVNIDVQFGPGSSVQFEPNGTSVTKNEGEQFGPISCSARCNPPCQYTWTKPDTTILFGAQLTITSLSIRDHGQFICTASNTIRDSQNKSLDVTVNYGPASVTLVPHDTQYNVTEGHKILTINCTADCRPACNYMWSGPNIPADTTNVLRLQSIQKKHTGVFNCTATNNKTNRSMRSSNVQLNVKFGPGSSLQFDPSNTSLTKNEGDKLGPIECTATCNPQCEYKWIKPDKRVINTGKLTIESLSTDDNGTFICSASNGIGSSQNKTIDVTVNYGPVAAILSPPQKEYTVTHGKTIPPITCTATCRPECKFMWSGPNVPADTVNVLSLQNIQKNQTGDFNCTAYNVVGNIQSSVVNVNVLYEPSVNNLLINGSNFTVRENSTVLLSCTFEGNPAPHNTWEKNNIILSQAHENNRQSLYTIQPVQCEDNGNYSCVANNSLGMSSAQQSLYVTCSPRLNFQVEQPNKKVGLPKGSELSLVVHLLAYPKPISTVWIFNDTKGNQSNIASNLKTYEFFKHVTFLNKTNLTQFDFGDYILKVENSLGSAIQTYHVVPQGPPDPVTILNVSCGVQTAVLYWRTSFNGGETQQFSIIINRYGKEMYIYDTEISSDDDEQIKHISITLTAGEYLFAVYGKNNYGNSNSTESNLCKVKEFRETDSDFAIGAAAGSGTAAAIVLILAIVLFVFIKKRRSLKGDDGRRSLTTEDRDDNDELKENPLYVTSGETANESAQLYGVVNKKTKSGETYTTENVDQGPVYSQVRKTDAKGKITSEKKKVRKSEKSGKAEKDMEMGSVYENSKDQRKNNDNDEVYANAVNNVTADNIYRPKKNKDGLIYADLDLSECAGEKKFVIRGLENRNNYAIIDLTKTAEPLPSDDEEDGQKSD